MHLEVVVVGQLLDVPEAQILWIFHYLGVNID